MKYKIENISGADEKKAIQTLAMSLASDPGFVYFLPDAKKRADHTQKIVSAMSGLLNIFDKKFMIKKNEAIVSVAMWVPPGKSIDIWRLINAGFFLIPFVMGLRVFQRIMKFLDIATRLQEEHMKKRDHWQLFYLGVHPDFQRQGYGKAVISEILSESNKTQTPVFVQTFTKESLNFFKKNGFNLLSKTMFSENCVMNCMVREPEPPGLKKQKSFASTRAKTPGKSAGKTKGAKTSGKKSGLKNR